MRDSTFCRIVFHVTNKSETQVLFFSGSCNITHNSYKPEREINSKVILIPFARSLEINALESTDGFWLYLHSKVLGKGTTERKCTVGGLWGGGGGVGGGGVGGGGEGGDSVFSKNISSFSIRNYL